MIHLTNTCLKNISLLLPGFITLMLGACSSGLELNTSSRTWIHPKTADGFINPSGEDAGNPIIALNDAGEGFMVWEQFNGTHDQIFLSSYKDGQWQHPTNLNQNISPAGQDASGPELAIDKKGDAIVVWDQSNGSHTQVYMSEYRNGVWTHPTDLSTDAISIAGSHARDLELDVNDSGTALVTWVQDVSGVQQLFISEYRNGTWTHPTDINDNITPDGGSVFDQEVKIDQQGNALIAWDQFDGTHIKIFFSEYRNNTWTHPTDLTQNISPDGQNADDPEIAMDDNGNAIIIWEQIDGTDEQVFFSEYRNSSWTHPTSLADNIGIDGQAANNADVVMNNNGVALIAWQQYDGNDDRLFLSEYRNGVWTHPSTLNEAISVAGSDVGDIKMAIDDNDNTILVWVQEAGAGNDDHVFMSEYRQGVWVHPTSGNDFISITDKDASDPIPVMNNNNQAFVVWEQEDGMDEDQIFLSSYEPIFF